MQRQFLWGGRFNGRPWVLFLLILNGLFFSLTGEAAEEEEDDVGFTDKTALDEMYQSPAIWPAGANDLAQALGEAVAEDDEVSSLSLHLTRPDKLSQLYPLYHALLRDIGSYHTCYLEDNTYDHREAQIDHYRAEVNQIGGRPNWAKIWSWLKQDPYIGMVFNPLMIMRIYQDQVKTYPGATLPEKFWHYAWRQLQLRIDELRRLEVQRPRSGRRALAQEVLRVMAITKRPLALEDIDQMVYLEDEMIALPVKGTYKMDNRRLEVVRLLAAQVGRFERPILLSEGSWQEFNGRLAALNGERWMIPLLTRNAGQALEKIITDARQSRKEFCRKLLIKKQQRPAWGRSY